jgi:hypothetical protein
MATVPLELYELFEKKLGKEEAKKAIELVKEALESIEEKAKEQKTLVKAELKEELRKELVTKEEFFGEIGKLRQEIETVRQELKGDFKELKGEMKVLKILIYVTILTVIFMNKGTIEYLVNLIRMVK